MWQREGERTRAVIVPLYVWERRRQRRSEETGSRWGWWGGERCERWGTQRECGFESDWGKNFCIFFNKEKEFETKHGGIKKEWERSEEDERWWLTKDYDSCSSLFVSQCSLSQDIIRPPCTFASLPPHLPLTFISHSSALISLSAHTNVSLMRLSVCLLLLPPTTVAVAWLIYLPIILLQYNFMAPDGSQVRLFNCTLLISEAFLWAITRYVNM